MTLNVLWIVTTQWRAQATGYAGDPNARTPAIDRLARQSINFAQAVTPHPFGPFARAAMLTGIRSPRNGVRDYFDPLPLEARTHAHDLAEQGYATAFFGKWHLWKRDPAAPLVGEQHAKTVVPPEARGGFEFWEGFESGFLLNDPWLHGTQLPEPMKFGGYQSNVICAQAGAWLRDADADGRPWFGMVSLEPPHPPYDAPAGEVAKRAEVGLKLRDNVPTGGEIEATARRELSGYYAHIEATDVAIGRLLDEIDEQDAKRGKQTVVVFTSVHGDMHGAHGLFRKGWPHEESVRVPLLVRVPGCKPEVRDDALSLQDLPRLITDLLGGEGVNRRFSPHAYISMPSVVALPQQCDRAWRGIRSRERKLIVNTDGEPWMFFDLSNDPLEQRNLVGDAGSEQEIAEWMVKLNTL